MPARIDDLPEHVARAIRTAPIAPAVRTLFARTPRPIVLAAEAAVDSAVPLALAQLVKLAAEGGRLELGSVLLADPGDPPCLALVSGDRMFEARGEAIGPDARDLA
ncbi:MAG TPA: hypothetical protein VMI75_10215, partial [Polyangiaceae bacterium]|nr:hypothetical protein [Polyangiaceae bacterium]